MSLLRWQPARRQDRDALAAFACTGPKRRVKSAGRWVDEHPAKWELTVQALIRCRIPPVGEPSRTVLLGWDNESLGAVSSYRALGDGDYYIDVIAVSAHLRGRGRGWAVEALNTTLDYITADAAADSRIGMTVAASIHEQNRASQRLFEAQGFRPTTAQPEHYQLWAAGIIIAGA